MKKKIPKKITLDILEKSAIKYLEKYSASEKQLIDILKRKILKTCFFYKTKPEKDYELIDLVVKKFKEIGLINDYYENSKLDEEVLKLAETIASKSTKVVKIGKEAFYKQLEMPLDKAYKYTSEIMSENMLALDAKEGISAFLEKRSPKWKNK